MPGISLNEDNSHYFSSRGADAASQQEMDRFVDQYAGTGVRELLFCPNCMTTSFDSAVWDPIWRDMETVREKLEEGDPRYAGCVSTLRWMEGAKACRDRGVDPYAYFCARARKKGISPWISMRMNDVHNADFEDSPLHSLFWRDHPEYRRVTYVKEGLSWVDRAFDYRHEAVRTYHFALIREMVSRWDFDGLELDFMRFGYMFAPGRELADAPLLSAFLRDVRALLNTREKESGHPVGLSVRVPAQPDTARRLGFDVPLWADEGLVDRVTVTPFWATADTDMPLELWRRLLGERVLLQGGVELLLRPHLDVPPERAVQTLETVRGCAASLWSRGADRLYLFNFMDSKTCMADMHNYRRMLCEAGDPAALEGLPRRHVLAYTDTVAPGLLEYRILPAGIGPDGQRTLRLHTGPVPKKGGAYVLLGVRENSSELRVFVGGRECTPLLANALPHPARDGVPRVFSIPDGALLTGDNVITVTSATGAELRSAEIDIDF